MKYCFSLLLLFFATSFSLATYPGIYDEGLYYDLYQAQQTPFYFLNPVPIKVKLLDNIDLSFFRNQKVVVMYRYRIEIPDDGSTRIDMRLRIWSSWQNSDLTELKLPVLDQEGGYKLVIEYTTPEARATERFEQPFYVYRADFLEASSSSNNDSRITENRTVTTNPQNRNVAALTETAPIKRDITNTSDKKSNDTNKTEERITSKDTLVDLSDVKVQVENRLGTKPPNVYYEVLPVYTASIAEQNIVFDADKRIQENFDESDTLMNAGDDLAEAGGKIEGKFGGDIFHILNDYSGTHDSVVKLQEAGISIDEPDKYGNTALNFAILSGMDDYALSLIDIGANPNLKNNMQFTALHLAVIKNDEDVINALLRKGADVNIQGNTGYTVLHIAAETGNYKLARELLTRGANPSIRTAQGLSSKTIARIQKNDTMLELLKNNGTSDVFLAEQSQLNSPPSLINKVTGNYPAIDFNLPYDNDLARKRQFNQIVQILSIPVLAVTSVVAVHFKTQANHNYTLSKIAESEDMARFYYDKTTKFDRMAYISGGISLVSVFGIIRSTLKKKSISGKMYKTINQGYIISK
jgi:hypothetical protein